MQLVSVKSFLNFDRVFINGKKENDKFSTQDQIPLSRHKRIHILNFDTQLLSILR